MTKRFFVRLGLLLLVAASGFLFVVWWTTPDHRINVDSFKTIKSGMALDEVEQIIGVPPGHYGAPSRKQGPTYLLASKAVLDPFEFNSVTEVVEWCAETGKLGLLLDKDRRVIAGQYESRMDDGLLAKIRRWLASFR